MNDSNKVKALPESLYTRIICLIENGKSTEQIVADLNKDERVGATPERLKATLPLLIPKNKKRVTDHLAINDAQYTAKEKAKAKAEAEANAKAEAEAKARAEKTERIKAEVRAKVKAKEEAKAKAKAEAEAVALIASLEKEERELSAKQARAEACHKLNAKRWHELHVFLNEEYARLLEIKKDVSAIEERVRQAVGEIGSLRQTMDATIDEAQPIIKRLEEVRESLNNIRNSRKKASILVYRDKIEAFRGDDQPINLDLTGWETKRNDIFTDQTGKYVELTIWQVEVVAKIWVIKELEILKSFEEVEFVFDNGLQGLEAYI